MKDKLLNDALSKRLVELKMSDFYRNIEQWDDWGTRSFSTPIRRQYRKDSRLIKKLVKEIEKEYNEIFALVYTRDDLELSQKQINSLLRRVEILGKKIKATKDYISFASFRCDPDNSKVTKDKKEKENE